MPILKYLFNKTLLAFKMPKSSILITNIGILNAKNKAFKMPKKKRLKHPYFGILNAKNIVSFYVPSLCSILFVYLVTNSLLLQIYTNIKTICLKLEMNIALLFALESHDEQWQILIFSNSIRHLNCSTIIGLVYFLVSHKLLNRHFTEPLCYSIKF